MQIPVRPTPQSNSKYNIASDTREFEWLTVIQFGLTGSARSKINMKALGTPDKPEENPFASFGKPKLIVNN